MSDPSLTAIRQQLEHVVGPTPWYWKTFPALQTADGRTCVWTHHGEEGPVGYVVSLSHEKQPEVPLLALNTYCRPFVISPGRLGIWCPEGRKIRVIAFDLNQMQPFELAEIAGWFKQSSERIYAKTPPIAEFEMPLSLGPGMHKVSVPGEFTAVDELILPTSYKAMSDDDPAFAIFVLYLQAGLVEVLPQKWFTAAQYRVGRQWISRAARDAESHRIFGECVGAGTFLLEEDGCRLDEWIEKRS
ncbi:MAG: hypothetical protein ABR874_10520 [Candidatus Sulfotelmatobacter sp.]|jgi:hypothetical protein